MGLITNQNLKQKLKKLSITDQVSELSLACHGVFSLKTFLHASRARNCERKISGEEIDLVDSEFLKTKIIFLLRARQ